MIVGRPNDYNDMTELFPIAAEKFLYRPSFNVHSVLAVASPEFVARRGKAGN